MKIKIRDTNLKCISDEYVPLYAVIELDNGQIINLTETEEGLCINCQQQSDLTLVAANAFIIKKKST